MTKSADKTILKANKRSKKDKLSKLKADKMIPANIYGLKKESIAVVVSKSDFNQVLKVSGETSVIFVDVSGEKQEPVLIGEIERHPLSLDVRHVTFRRVDLKQKIEQDVQVEVTGEFSVPDATYLLVKDSITVSALPEDLPESFVVDITSFKTTDDNITVADLTYDASKVEIVLGEEEVASEVQVVVVQEVKEEPKEDEGDAEGSDETSTEEKSSNSEEKESEGDTKEE